VGILYFRHSKEKNMTPLSFEWQWNIGYYMFMGFLYLALAMVGGGLTYVLIKTWLGLNQPEKPYESPDEISYRSKYSEY
jgi:hypothetical protein